MTHPIKSPKKLIEVALPLDDINEAAAREKWGQLTKRKLKHAKPPQISVAA